MKIKDIILKRNEKVEEINRLVSLYYNCKFNGKVEDIIQLFGEIVNLDCEIMTIMEDKINEI